MYVCNICDQGCREQIKQRRGIWSSEDPQWTFREGGLGRLHQELIVKIWRRRGGSRETWGQDVQEEGRWARPAAGECWHFQETARRGWEGRDWAERGWKQRRSEGSTMSFKTLSGMLGLWLFLWVRWDEGPGQGNLIQLRFNRIRVAAVLKLDVCVSGQGDCLSGGGKEGIPAPSEHVSLLPHNTFSWC